MDTLCKYLTNIVDHPGEEKYRRIRLSNKILQERVLPLEGAAQFLEAAGFEQTDDCFVFPEDGDPEQLCVLRDALRTAEPVLPVLDRGLRVLTPAQGRSDVQLPDEFFHLTPEELLREQEARCAHTLRLLLWLQLKPPNKLRLKAGSLVRRTLGTAHLNIT